MGMGLNTFSFIFLVSFRKKVLDQHYRLFFLLARTRKFPTPPFILFPLVPSGTIQASEGEPRTKARTVLSVIRQPNTPARQIGFAHTTKTHFPDLFFFFFCEEKNCSFSSVLSGSGREIKTQARGQSVLSVSKVQAGTYSSRPVGHARSQPK